MRRFANSRVLNSKGSVIKISKKIMREGIPIITALKIVG
jgi:FlaA1/EpsC-like NDP-sugar epimerase